MGNARYDVEDKYSRDRVVRKRFKSSHKNKDRMRCFNTRADYFSCMNNTCVGRFLKVTTRDG